MGYALGIDLGTTFTAAAVLRDGRAHVVQLGNRSAAIPSAVFLRDDEAVVTGDAAVRRGATDPIRLAREFKRRLGDPAPIYLAGTPMSAESLMARLARATIEAVTDREGGPPDDIAICHPANWGPYKLELLQQVCRLAGIDRAVLLTEPEAAALHYASLERVETGSIIAVYDLGGGTFDATVLRKHADGFEILGTPEGIERLGGIDFDGAVLEHVRRAVHPAFDELDPDDPTTMSLLARLRQECIDAKEALSDDLETSITVVLPGLQTEVRLTRAEFEGMIRVPLQETVASLRRALGSARIEPAQLSAVLLVGGSSRIPMVAEMVGAELGRPVAVDTDPKHVVALGAARAAAGRVVGAARAEVAAVAVAAATPPPAPAATATPTAAASPTAPPSPGPAPAALTPPPAPTSVPAVTPAPGPAGAAAPVPAGPVSPPAPPPASSASPPAAAPARPVPGIPPSPPSPRPDPPATRPAGSSTPRRSRTKGLAVAGVVAALAVAGAVVAVASGGGGGGGGFDGWISACPAAGEPAVCITAIEFDGDQLSASFAQHDVTLGENDLAAVFFLASVDESGAASIDTRTANWRPWGPASPFSGTNAAGQQGFTAGETSGATALCVLVGNASGQVVAGTGNCAQLPPTDQ